MSFVWINTISSTSNRFSKGGTPIEKKKPRAMHRVVITGMGAVTPLGIGKDTFWNALIHGESGIGPLTLIDPTRFPTKIAGEVKKFDPTTFISKKEARRMDRFTQFAVVAAFLAVEDSGLAINDGNRDRIGVCVSSGIGGIATMEEQCKIFLEKGPDRISPFFIPMLIPNMASGQISILLGLRGPNTCVVTACATGNNALGDAYRLIQRGDALVMVAGGSESAITCLGIGGFCAMKAMSTRNDEPEKASCPFDKRRDGFVMAEGGGVMILERMEHAVSRGANIYAEVIGYGMTSDAYHMTAPDPLGNGAKRAMSLALADAKITPLEIDYINAHGTSTQLNDKIETRAIKEVFGDHARKVAISSTKSMTGHVLGATGALETMVCALAIQDGIVPPTINYEEPDPECDLDYVPNAARRMPVKTAMSNSFGFGGHNAVLVVREFKG